MEVVFVDKLRETTPTKNWPFKRSCHMFSVDLDALHRMAAAIGMRRSWFQPMPPHTIPHYDLTVNKRKAAIENGAIEASWEEVKMVIRFWRNRNAT